MSSTKEKIKNVLICLLLAGMLYLTYSVWFFDSPFESIGLENLIGIETGNDVSGEGEGADLDAFGIRPMSVLVRDGSSSRGVVYNSEASDAIYTLFRDETADAFDSIKDRERAGEAEWQTALSGEGVFFDYRGNVPLEALRLWLGSSFSDDAVSGRYVFLSTAERNIKIFIKNSQNGEIFSMNTGANSEGIKKLFAEVSAESASFAFENEDEDFSAIAPETVILSSHGKLPVISAYNSYAAFGSVISDSCLEAFSLRDVSPGTYSEADGTQVYIADMVTLKISPEGIVSYTDPRDAIDETLGIGVEFDGESPSFAEQMEAARSLAAFIAAKIPGAGGIYLIDVSEADGNAQFVFGRHIGGVPVDMKGSVYFASISIKSEVVSAVRVNLRGYDITSETADTLADRLAAAAVAGSGSTGDMNLRYSDAGEETLMPAWFIGGAKKAEEEKADELGQS